MKPISMKYVLASALFVVLSGVTSQAFAQNTSFSGVSWRRDTSNSFEADTSGCGSVPSTPSAGATGPFTFTLSGSCSSGSRREFKMERRGGIHSMTGYFNVSSSSAPNFSGGISIAQTHDDGTGSSGVFSIYQVRYSGGSYYLTVQSDNTDYDEFSWLRITPGSNYFMDIQTYSNGGDSYERARVWSGTSMSGTLLKTWIINDDSGDSGSGSDASNQYKKIGAYLLSSSSVSNFRITWTNVNFYTGTD